MAAPATSGRQVEVNGASLYVEEHGHGVSLVLVCPSMVSLQFWDRVVPLLAPHARVVTFDNRGHGRSSNPSGELSHRLLADDTAALIEALGLDRPFVGGWSLGGGVALEFGRHYPKLTRGLIVGGATTDYRNDAALARRRAFFFADEAGAIDFDALEREEPDWVLLLRAHHPGSDERWRRVAQHDLTMGEGYPGLAREQVERITTPTLVVQADHDQLIPLDEGLKLYAWLPNAELAVLPGRHHANVDEEPATFAAAVLDFMARHRDG